MMTSLPDYVWPACQIMTSLPDYDDLLARLWWPACQIMMTCLPDYDHINDHTVPAVNLSFCGTVWQFAVLALLCHTHTHQWAAVFLWNCLQQFAVISIMSIIALYCNKHQIMSRNCCMCMWLPCLGGRELKESAPRAVEGAARGTWTSAAIPLVSRPAGYTWTTACLVQYQKSFLHDAPVE